MITSFYLLFKIRYGNSQCYWIIRDLRPLSGLSFSIKVLYCKQILSFSSRLSINFQVKRGLVSGQCRVLSCRFYHKNIKDLKRHLERAHSMTLASHKKLPPSLLSSVIKKNKGKSHMKHRKVELCSIKGCKHYMQPQTDLTRHLKNCHNGMTKKEFYAKRY